MCCRCHPAYQHVGTGAEESAGAFIHNNPSESDRGIFRPPSHGIWQAPVRWMDFLIYQLWNRSSMWEQKKKRKITDFFPSCLLLNPGWKHIIHLLHIFVYFFPLIVQNEHNYTVMMGGMDCAFLLQHCRCQLSVEGWGHSLWPGM